MLDLAPHEVDPDYNLNLSDEAEVLRRVVMPLIHGTLPAEHVLNVGLRRRAGSGQDHWPADVQWPDDIFCLITFSTGEQEELYLGEDGWVDPHDLADRFVSDLEDMWCESGPSPLIMDTRLMVMPRVAA